MFVCFGLDVGWFRVGLGWFRVGFGVGLGLDVDWFCGWPRVGFTGFLGWVKLSLKSQGWFWVGFEFSVGLALLSLGWGQRLA